MPFTAAADALAHDLSRLRRELHADPEIGLQLPRTQARLLAELEPLGLHVTLGRSSTALTAVPVDDRTEHTLYVRDPDGHRVGLSDYRF